MEFLCEDLRNAGLVLVPPSQPDYGRLLDDIEQRLSLTRSVVPSALAKEVTPAFDRRDPAAAILLNKSGKAIAAWSLIWTYEEFGGRRYTSSYFMGAGSVPSLLLPFGMHESKRKFAGYWDVILPGSKRYLSAGCMFGDNTDVRRPTAEEEKNGRGAIGLGTSKTPPRPMDRMKCATLSLDGVFFSDGEFFGPNKRQLFEQIVFKAEVYQKVAGVAREQAKCGVDVSSILAGVERVGGIAHDRSRLPRARKMDPEHLRQQARSSVAWHISTMRQLCGDEETVSMLVGWADSVMPRYRCT